MSLLTNHNQTAVITGAKAQAYINARQERESNNAWWEGGATRQYNRRPIPAPAPLKIVTSLKGGRPQELFGCVQLGRLFGIPMCQAARHRDELLRLPSMKPEARRLTVRMILTGK